MPDFGNPFSGLAHDRKLTNEELTRAIRFMIAAEYEAVQLYTQLAESTDNELAKDVLYDIADEEKLYSEGAEEVEEEIEKLKKHRT